jgi:CBS domain-containing protein
MANVASVLREKREGGTVYSVDPEAPVLEAVKRMAEHGVGALLVMQEDKLVGLLSERDYARKVVLLGRASASTKVREIMSSPVISVTRDQSVHDCMQIINDRRIRHLAVVEHDKVLGLISIGDCARAMLAEQRTLIEQLENYVRG